MLKHYQEQQVYSSLSITQLVILVMNKTFKI